MHIFTCTLPNLFDEYVDSGDAHHYLLVCSETPVVPNFVELLVQAYGKQLPLFQANELQVYVAIERLVSADAIKCAAYITQHVIIKHFKSIGHIEDLLRLLLRLCSSVAIESRTSFCQQILCSISYEFQNQKYPKKFAPIFFELLVTILELAVAFAVPCASLLLDKKEFYPWKDLTPLLTRCIRACIAYDTIINDASAMPLDKLERILTVLIERAKINTNIFHAMHDLAVEAINKWLLMSNDEIDKAQNQHVFSMGILMVDLVDPQKITVDTCCQWINILEQRMDSDTMIPYQSFIRVSSVTNIHTFDMIIVFRVLLFD
jgi:hypothetical protein